MRFDRATSLYAVDPLDLNHDAAMRIGGEAPWWRAHSPLRYGDQTIRRVATTSDHQQRVVVTRRLPISVLRRRLRGARWSSRRPQDDALWHLAGGDQAPQRYQ